MRWGLAVMRGAIAGASAAGMIIGVHALVDSIFTGSPIAFGRYLLLVTASARLCGAASYGFVRLLPDRLKHLPLGRAHIDREILPLLSDGRQNQ